MLDEQEIVRAPAAVFFRRGDVARGAVLGVRGVPGDHRVLQVYGVQEFFDLGDLVGVLRDGVLGDDDFLLVQHRGEQFHLLPVADPAQPFAVDRDRGQQPLQLPRVRQRPQPPAGELVQLRRVDLLQQGTDPFLAGGDDPPAQRMRPAAQPAQDVLRQIGRLVADLPEIPRPGQHAGHRHRQHEHQRELLPLPLARVRDQRKHLQQARDLVGWNSICAGHGSSAGMQNWHRRPLDPVDPQVWSPVIKPGGRPLRESSHAEP